YTFNAPAGYLVTSHFISFDTEANYDYLRISDGPVETDPPMATYHGPGLTIPDYTSTTGALTFRFTSDGSVTYAGWEAEISLVEVPVGVPDPVTLLSPTNNATGVAIIGLALDWAAATTGGTANYYEVYMSTDEDPVANNEFFAETPNSILYIADTDWVLTDSTIYYWTVVGVSIAEGAGDYPLPFNFTTADPYVAPLGDMISNPFIIPSLPYNASGTTVGFSDDYGPYGDPSLLVNLVNPYTSYFSGSTLGASPDVVYQLTLTEPTLLAIDLLGSNFDTALALVTAPGTGPENVILINDDYYSSPVSWVSYVNSGSNYVPAGTYYILIGGYGSSSGNYVLNVTTAVPSPAPVIDVQVNHDLDIVYLS
ncbi:MAG: CUB domain-containing protein, partial [Candidatus Cloacimonadaceae bacterium]|nr:CUB domain-containing protein [Candidatus Cloacimonadaceae bacterium]